MQTYTPIRQRPLPDRYPPEHAPRSAEHRAASVQPAASDETFVSMLGGYRSSGGLAHMTEVVARIESGLGEDAGQLQRWSATRRIICFEWNAQRWLPRFQFAAAHALPHPDVELVLAELNAVFDECEVAQWFATPNSSLSGRAPVDVIVEQPAAVLEAARGDRFIADG
jgi:hypothetical protein